MEGSFTVRIAEAYSSEFPIAISNRRDSPPSIMPCAAHDDITDVAAYIANIFRITIDLLSYGNTIFFYYYQIIMGSISDRATLAIVLVSCKFANVGVTIIWLK